MSFKKIFNKFNKVSGVLSLLLFLSVIVMASGQASNFARIVLGTANYGTDPSTTADIVLQNDETISNYTDGTIDFGAANLATTGTIDFAGDFTLENDEIIDNGTDGDVQVIANDSLEALLDFILTTSVDTSDIVDNMQMNVYFRWDNDTTGNTDWGTIRVTASDVTSDSRDSYFTFKSFTANSEKTLLTLGNAGTNYSGAYGAALDFVWYSDTGGDSMIWDASAEGLVIVGTNAQNALTVSDGNVDIEDDVDINGVLEADQITVNSTVEVTALDTFCTVTGVVRYCKITIGGVTFWAPADTATVL